MKGNIVIFEDNVYKGRFTATEFFNLTENNGTPRYQRDIAFQVLIDGRIVKIGEVKAYIDYGDAHTSNEVMDVGCLKNPESGLPELARYVFEVGDAVTAKENFTAEFRSSGVPVVVERGDIFTITSFRRNGNQAVLQSSKYGGDILALVSNLGILLKREFL
ncbi:hypothetical protein HCA69_12280 [Listeria grandensis]|uniref:Uncharacterized protein n=1 Tax=Listeria grandensis TaxID=1494963 RepID=A0A7X1CQL8_9LIST|nr:hypothetical protein [Listeria grandensis]MBC1937149.1 hypothetical protein [Listeria grandensis]